MASWLALGRSVLRMPAGWLTPQGLSMYNLSGTAMYGPAIVQAAETGRLWGPQPGLRDVIANGLTIRFMETALLIHRISSHRASRPPVTGKPRRYLRMDTNLAILDAMVVAGINKRNVATYTAIYTDALQLPVLDRLSGEHFVSVRATTPLPGDFVITSPRIATPRTETWREEMVTLDAKRAAILAAASFGRIRDSQLVEALAMS